jgi:hypothetical protein
MRWVTPAWGQRAREMRKPSFESRGDEAAPTTVSVDDALRSVQSAVAARNADDDGAEALAGVHAAVFLASTRAREHGISPEAFVVRLKHTLDTAKPASTAEARQKAELNARLLSLGIRAYFSSDSDGPKPR